MVGAAVLVVVLGTPTIVAWWSARGSHLVSLPHVSIADSIPAVSFPASAPAAIRELSDPLMFLSSAPPESLELLPGVGPVLAGRIAEARRERGAFRSWDDLDRVRGIGPKTIERLQSLSQQP
jgi:competence protein ComEA